MTECLHCVISKLLQERHAAGETNAYEVVGKLMEVIGDIVNSVEREDRPRLVIFALQRFGSLTGGDVVIADTAKQESRH